MDTHRLPQKIHVENWKKIEKGPLNETQNQIRSKSPICYEPKNINIATEISLNALAKSGLKNERNINFIQKHSDQYSLSLCLDFLSRLHILDGLTFKTILKIDDLSNFMNILNKLYFNYNFRIKSISLYIKNYKIFDNLLNQSFFLYSPALISQIFDRNDPLFIAHTMIYFFSISMLNKQNFIILLNYDNFNINSRVSFLKMICPEAILISEDFSNIVNSILTIQENEIDDQYGFFVKFCFILSKNNILNLKNFKILVNILSWSKEQKVNLLNLLELFFDNDYMDEYVLFKISVFKNERVVDFAGKILALLKKLSIFNPINIAITLEYQGNLFFYYNILLALENKNILIISYLNENNSKKNQYIFNLVFKHTDFIDIANLLVVFNLLIDNKIDDESKFLIAIQNPNGFLVFLKILNPVMILQLENDCLQDAFNFIGLSCYLPALKLLENDNLLDKKNFTLIISYLKKAILFNSVDEGYNYFTFIYLLKKERILNFFTLQQACFCVDALMYAELCVLTKQIGLMIFIDQKVFCPNYSKLREAFLSLKQNNFSDGEIQYYARNLLYHIDPYKLALGFIRLKNVNLLQKYDNVLIAQPFPLDLATAMVNDLIYDPLKFPFNLT